MSNVQEEKRNCDIEGQILGSSRLYYFLHFRFLGFFQSLKEKLFTDSIFWRSFVPCTCRAHAVPPSWEFLPIMWSCQHYGIHSAGFSKSWFLFCGKANTLLVSLSELPGLVFTSKFNSQCSISAKQI